MTLLGFEMTALYVMLLGCKIAAREVEDVNVLLPNSAKQANIQIFTMKERTATKGECTERSAAAYVRVAFFVQGRGDFLFNLLVVSLDSGGTMGTSSPSSSSESGGTTNPRSN